MPSNYQKLVDAYYSNLCEGGRFSSIIAARQFAAQILGEQVAPGTSSTKLVEECLEAGLVRAAKEILKGASTPKDGFDLLVDLYQRQPNLSTRSSSSVQQQAYSTPLPIAYLAATLAGVSPEKTVYEPTAGHGALILNSAPAKAIVNELNAERATDLRAQGYQTTEFDASTYLPQQQVDVVIANPPFGTVQVNGKTRSWMVRGGDSTESYSTSQIDHAIAFQSLKAMKDNGRAVLILGAPMANKVGNREDASTTYNNAQNRAFYYSLYQNYNVTQHFCVSGNLYARQGTSFPVDLIVIEGRGRSFRRLPATDLPSVYRSFDELKELLPDVPTNQQSLDSSHRGLNSSSIDRSADTPRPGTDHNIPELPRTVGNASQLDDSARGEEGSHPDDRTSDRAGVDLSNRDSSDQRPSSGMGGINHDVQPNISGSVDVSGSQRPSLGAELMGIPSRSEQSKPGDSGALTGDDVRGMAGIDGSNLHSVNTGEVIVNEPTADLQQAENKQVPYKPQSQGSQIGTLVPVNMETAISSALARLEQQKGSLDDYVAEQLEIDSRDSLNKRFSAEQVDGLGRIQRLGEYYCLGNG